MRDWLLAVVVAGAAACGRVGFTAIDAGAEAATDGGADAPDAPDAPDAHDALPVVVQTAAIVPASPVATTTLSVMATRAGDLLVVATADITGAVPLQSIGDDAGNTYVSANAEYGTDDILAGEVWYAAAAAAGATTLQITDGSDTQREVWFVEVDGASALDTANTIDNGSDDGVLVGPSVTPPRLPAIIVTVIDVAGATTGLGSDFTPLLQLHGDQAAFELVSAPGTYAPTWTTNAAGQYAGATVAFAPP